MSSTQADQNGRSNHHVDHMNHGNDCARTVAYVAPASSRIPSREANSIHIMKMSQAFQQEGYSLSLFASMERRNQLDYKEIYHHYGIHTPFSWEHIVLPWIRQWPIGYLMAHLYGVLVVWRAKKLAIDLIYTRDVGAAAWASLLGFPVIFEAHAPTTSKFEGRFRVMIRGKGFQKMVVITNVLKNMFLEQYEGVLSPEQILVEPDAVDLERFINLPTQHELRLQRNIPSEQFVVGYAGHMYPGRGIDHILDIAARLPEVLFLLIGGQKEDVQHYQSLAAARGMTHVNFVGFVPNADIPSHLALCDVLLMPYQARVSDYRGNDTSLWMSPMKLFEYMASERLIISSDLPVFLEILNESNAVLCEPSDVGAWQRAIEHAMSDIDWRKATAHQARRDVERYTWRNRVRRVMEAVYGVAATPPPAEEAYTQSRARSL
jgi:glycosyltransferase involved in cell wall biosynthesis